MRHQRKLVGDLYKLYGLNDINSGRLIRPCGTQHVVLFDCAEPTKPTISDVSDAQEEFRHEKPEIKPIDTDYGAVFSPALAGLLKNLPSNDSVQVHIVPWLDPDEANAPETAVPTLHCLFDAIKHMTSGQSKKPPRVESQVRRGYHLLVNKYYVDSQAGPGGTRDAIYLFGDGEGAYSANAVARIIANVGILQQRAFWDDEGEDMIKIGLRNIREDWEFYSVTRAFDTRVELLGLWTDDGALPCLTPLRDPSGVVDVVKYSRFPCKHCGQYFTDAKDGSCHGVCSTQPLFSRLGELFSIANDITTPLTTNDSEESSAYDANNVYPGSLARRVVGANDHPDLEDLGDGRC